MIDRAIANGLPSSFGTVGEGLFNRIRGCDEKEAFSSVVRLANSSTSYPNQALLTHR